MRLDSSRGAAHRMSYRTDPVHGPRDMEFHPRMEQQGDRGSRASLTGCTDRPGGPGQGWLRPSRSNGSPDSRPAAEQVGKRASRSPLRDAECLGGEQTHGRNVHLVLKRKMTKFVGGARLRSRAPCSMASDGPHPPGCGKEVAHRIPSEEVCRS